MKAVVLVCGLLVIASDGRAELLRLPAGGQPVRLEYRADAHPFKPYVAQLHTPAGVPVLRDAPADHLHHHALMFAVAVDGVTFWEEKAGAGRQVPRATVPGPGRIAQTLDWTTAEGRVVLHEEREIRLIDVPGGAATLLTWRSRLRAPAALGRVELTGHHYYGLGARFVAAMDQGGEFVHAAGEPGEIVRGTERLTHGAWCVYRAAIDGRPVAIGIFDDPGNPRHPARMFTMAGRFAYLAATLNLWKEPYLLPAGRPLELRYGVAVWDGRPTRPEIEATYRHWQAGRD